MNVSSIRKTLRCRPRPLTQLPLTFCASSARKQMAIYTALLLMPSITKRLHTRSSWPESESRMRALAGLPSTSKSRSIARRLASSGSYPVRRLPSPHVSPRSRRRPPAPSMPIRPYSLPTVGTSLTHSNVERRVNSLDRLDTKPAFVVCHLEQPDASPVSAPRDDFVAAVEHAVPIGRQARDDLVRSRLTTE